MTSASSHYNQVLKVMKSMRSGTAIEVYERLGNRAHGPTFRQTIQILNQLKGEHIVDWEPYRGSTGIYRIVEVSE